MVLQLLQILNATAVADSVASDLASWTEGTIFLAALSPGEQIGNERRAKITETVSAHSSHQTTAMEMIIG
jgi:hypothetical protein